MSPKNENDRLEVNEDSLAQEDVIKDAVVQDSAGPQRLLGQTIDSKYHIEELLGRGGMGVVYRATHTLIERSVAIKMLHSHLLEDVDETEFMERFRREARTQAKIEHPHAVTVHDFGLHQGVPYLVMQFIEGVTLKTLLKDVKPFPRERGLPFVIQVSEAIHAAHLKGIIHRDLKPDNIIVSTDENGHEKAVVTDFGIAKFLISDTPANDMTQAGNAMGTPLYMSPEQAQGKAVDARSDVYSVGVILYEICTGECPFVAESAVGVMMRHMTEKPASLHKKAPELNIPLALEKVVLKAIEKAPEARQQSLAELLDELRTAVPEECTYPGSSKLQGPLKNRSFEKVLLAAVLILSTTAIIFGYQFKNSIQKNQALRKAVEAAPSRWLDGEEAEKAKWSLVSASLDDALEKTHSISEFALKAARYNQRIDTIESASKREQFENLRDKTVEECRALVLTYSRELQSLSTLTNPESLEELILKYVKEVPKKSKLLPNRVAIAEQIKSHIKELREGKVLDTDQLIASSIKAANPDILTTYSGFFSSFCSSCEREI